jgi:hypothetical protein
MTQLAAIRYRAGFPIDDFMADMALRLHRRGRRLSGLVQRNHGDCDSGCATMALEDLASGRRFPISEDRGAGATGCRLDASGLAAAAGALAASLVASSEGAADLVLVNKFGRQEALGQGLRQEIAAAIAADLPVLIAVREDVLPAWRAFAGDDWLELSTDPDAIEAWADARAEIVA